MHTSHVEKAQFGQPQEMDPIRSETTKAAPAAAVDALDAGRLTHVMHPTIRARCSPRGSWHPVRGQDRRRRDLRDRRTGSKPSIGGSRTPGGSLDSKVKASIVGVCRVSVVIRREPRGLPPFCPRARLCRPPVNRANPSPAARRPAPKPPRVGPQLSVALNPALAAGWA